MRASVIIISYNNRKDLARSIPSILPSLSNNDELIVVDNASSDDSPVWIEENYPKIRIIKSHENLGYAGGNNLAAENAYGKYLAFINPDTSVDPGWLDALIFPLEAEHPDDLTTSSILLLNAPDHINTCGTDVHITGITLCRGTGMLFDHFPEQEEVSAISGASFAIRKETFQALGGFDEDFFMYMEDIDLSWRARLAGLTCIFVPESVIWHDYRLAFGPKKVFFQERNRYLMILKSMRWATIFVLLPIFLLAEIISWSFVLLRDRKNLGNKIEAYRWISQNWKTIMEKRNEAQNQRIITDRILLKQTTYSLSFDQVGQDLITRTANIVFSLFFFVLRSLALILVWW